jgi:hypothetical protein
MTGVRNFLSPSRPDLDRQPTSLGSLRPIGGNADRRCVTSGSGDTSGLIEKELGSA